MSVNEWSAVPGPRQHEKARGASWCSSLRLRCTAAEIVATLGGAAAACCSGAQQSTRIRAWAFTFSAPQV
jgi:hypothetical protein